MKCYYHESDNAVASCQHCGKALCKPCASKYSPCLCDECFNIRQAITEVSRKSKKKYTLIDTGSEYMMVIIKGLISSVALTLLFNALSKSSTVSLDMSIFFFFVPFGWVMITYFEQWLPSLKMSNPIFVIFYMVLKIVVSMLLGIPCFLYQTIRFIYKLTQLSKV